MLWGVECVLNSFSGCGFRAVEAHDIDVIVAIGLALVFEHLVVIGVAVAAQVVIFNFDFCRERKRLARDSRPRSVKAAERFLRNLYRFDRIGPGRCMRSTPDWFTISSLMFAPSPVRLVMLYQSPSRK